MWRLLIGFVVVLAACGGGTNTEGVSDYRAQVDAEIADLRSAMRATDDLLDTMQTDDQAWSDNLGAELQAVQQAHENISAMEPPPEMQEAHALLVSGTGQCNEFAFSLAGALEDMDSDLLDRAMSQAATCSERIQEAQEMMQ